MGANHRGILFAAVLACPLAAHGADIVADVTITVREGLAHARYALPGPVRSLPLKRAYSAALRARAWKIRTRGVRLEGSALVADRPFDEVDIVVRDPGHIRKDYPPVIGFSGGGVAVYTALFDAGTAGDLTRYRFKPTDGQAVVLFGRREPVTTSWIGGEDDQGTYAYFGRDTVSRTPAGLAVLDRELPGWVAREFDAAWPRLTTWYRERFGRDARYTPFVLFTTGALDGPGANTEGHVLPGVLALRLHGNAWRTPGDDAKRRLRWLFAHEAAHFWNSGGADMMTAPWMHEGAANEFADRAMRALDYTTQAEVAASRNRALNECLLGLDGQSVNARVAQGTFDVAYSCGQVMAIYSEAALRDQWRSRTLFDLWRELLAKGRYTQADYLVVLADLADDGAADIVRKMADGDGFAPEALQKAFGDVDIALRPLMGDVPQAVSREVATRLLVRLMGADCGGRYSITQTDLGMRLEGGPDCGALKETIEVREVEGYPLLRDAAIANVAVQARCKKGESVRIAHGPDLKAFEWRCPATVPQAPRLLEFSRGG